VTTIEDRITIDAPAARIYTLAARVERWPEILPHYHRVTVLRDGAEERLVEMAATRDGFPVKWTSTQRLDPVRHTVGYHHVRGVTRGMDVLWTIDPAPDGARGALVRIVHDFDPPWPPVVGPLAARYVVCGLFVHDIAVKTLRGIKRVAESMGAVPAISDSDAPRATPIGRER